MKRLSGSDEDAERETDWLGCNADISKLCKITKSSLWCKSRLLWHFWYFPSFCCLYKLVQVQKNSCRFTDGTQREEILKMQTCRHRGFSKTQRRGLRFND